MFGRKNRKAAPEIATIARGWNGTILEITWRDGAHIYRDSQGILTENAWVRTAMTSDHWTQVWEVTGLNAMRMSV